MKATCFFCYAWDEDNERYKQLDFLRRTIEAESNELVEVILDKHSYEVNADFNELRNKIQKYDLVMVFCTPDLKEIVFDRNSNKNKNREVLKEIDIISDRFYTNDISVFPVIFEGDKDSALLDLFINKNVKSFDDFEVFKNKRGKYCVPQRKKAVFNRFIDKVISTTIFNNYNRSQEYENARIAMDKLFGLTDNYDIPSKCLVIPDLYDDIRSQRCCFVAGRKGSGKSTFIHNFRDMDVEYFNKHYKVMIPLLAENFNHENAFSMLLYNHRKDRAIIEPHDILCLFWQLYFVLHCIITVRKEIEIRKIERTDKRYNDFNKIAFKLLELIGFKTKNGRCKSVTDPSLPKTLFNAAVEIIDDYYDVAVKEIRDGELVLTSYGNQFTLTKVLVSVFGETATERFFDGLKQCPQKILLSLDGFDTHSEDFRMSTERYNQDSDEYRGRIEYEDLFFRTLIEVVTQIRNGTSNDDKANILHQCMDFFVVLPRDKYDFIKKRDRDSFKKTYGYLTWSGYELMDILIKRLEYIIHLIDPAYKFSESFDLFERIKDSFSFFNALPSTMSMTVNGNTMSMSLFNYILRMSIWRPREVISNWSQIMTLMVRVLDVSGRKWEIDNEGMKYRLNEDNIKLILKRNADKIIDDEFIGENYFSFRNIEDVLNSFQNMNEQNSIEEFKGVLEKIKFDTAFSYDMRKVENKLLVLYQLGVIGLLYNKDQAQKNHYLTHVCFEFNEGMSPFFDFQRQGLQNNSDISIIFNPLFASRLNLRYNTTELIGNWSSDYLWQNYLNKKALHGM